MRYKNILDFHTHSDNSPDAQHSVSLMCEYAVKNGVRGLAITDHCECDAYFKDSYNILSAQSVFETGKCRSVFAGQLVVLIGTELGQPILDLKAAEIALHRPSMDFVLASMHNLEGYRDFYYLDYSLPENNPEKLLHLYFDCLIQIVDWGKFDSLAHLTYPLRYMVGEHGIDVDITKYYDQIDILFRGLIQKGKALEINTSGLRQKIGTTVPDLELVKRYRSLGGELITIGSDAHTAYDVGEGVAEGMEIATEAGFRYTALYQRRTPTLIKIE